MNKGGTIGALVVMLALLLIALWLLRSKDVVTAQLKFGGFVEGPDGIDAGAVLEQRAR